MNIGEPTARKQIQPVGSQQNPRCLGDMAATVRPKDWPKLRSAAAQLGLLFEAPIID